MELAGRCAIVTGSSRGIGKAMAIALAQAGASVVLAARTQKEPGDLEKSMSRGSRQLAGLLPGTIYQTAAEIAAGGGEALAVPCDVTSEQAVQAMVSQAMDRFGKIDLLLNNAAIFPRYPYLEATPEAFDNVMHVNVLGYYLTMKHVLPHMIHRGSGSVINVTAGTATGRSVKTRLGADLILYGMSKAAVNRLTTFVADEVRAHGIAVNALIPGLIETPGNEDALPEDFDYAKEGHKPFPASPEVFTRPITFLATQTAESFTGNIVHNMEYGQTWP